MNGGEREREREESCDLNLLFCFQPEPPLPPPPCLSGRASLWSSCVVLPLLALTWMSAVLAITDRRSTLFQVMYPRIPRKARTHMHTDMCADKHTSTEQLVGVAQTSRNNVPEHQNTIFVICFWDHSDLHYFHLTPPNKVISFLNASPFSTRAWNQ